MRTFYLMSHGRSQSGMSESFSAYELTPQGLEVLWPTPTDEEWAKAGYNKREKDSAKTDRAHATAYELACKRMGMVRNRSRSGDSPNFVFTFGGCGYSKQQSLAEHLCSLFGDVDVYAINGHSPSRVGRFTQGPQYV